jgi:hypothetical protein
VKQGSIVKASDVWEQVIEAYIRLRLSFTTDRLPAIAGIAKPLEVRHHLLWKHTC